MFPDLNTMTLAELMSFCAVSIQQGDEVLEVSLDDAFPILFTKLADVMVARGLSIPVVSNEGSYGGTDGETN